MHQKNLSVEGQTYKRVISFLSLSPLLWRPFLIFAILETLALVLLYLAPREPFNVFFGPLVTSFWDQRFLHYPAHFVLLPKAALFFRLALTVVFGAFFAATASIMVSQLCRGGEIDYKKASTQSLKKYVVLFALSVLMLLLMYVLAKIMFWFLVKYFLAGHSKLLFLKAGLWLGPMKVIIILAIVLLVRLLFLYSIPALVIGEKKFFEALKQSFGFAKRFAMPTFVFAALPMLFYLPIAILLYNSVFLIERFFPEIVFLICLLGAFINVFIVDMMMVLTAAVFYIEHTK